MIHVTYKGLSDQEVIVNRERSGPNILRELGKKSGSIFVEVFKEPMILLLFVASFIYFLLKMYEEGFIMIAAIFFVGGISVYQQIRSENAIHALRKLTRSQVIVIRNGKHVSVPSEELVVDDVVIFSEGQEVAADAVILDQNDLSVDESLLTGESFPVQKSDKDALLYAGTIVVSGMSHAKVIAVGNKTRIGQLGITMQGINKEKTPLQIQINSFVKRMATFGIIAFLLVTIFNYVESGSWLHGIMHGLVLAMAVLPEEIPVALSTFMALGAYQMSKRNVLVKHPQTVEALGAATVICIDKTGTITENKMTVDEVYDFNLKKIFKAAEKSEVSSYRKLMLNALLASEPVPFDPMEKAIHRVAEDLNFLKTDYTMIHEYPLSGSPPFMTHVYLDKNNQRIIACKGSPEGVLKNSNLTDDEKLEVMEVVRSMASKGNRVLGVAESYYGEQNLPQDQEEFQWSFSGLVALNDPPKKNIAEVIKSFYEAGITVKMITGDFPDTAISIAKKIGIRNSEKCITGNEIRMLSDEELKEKVLQWNIFARIMPETKLRIVNSLKEMNEVVAMTGDGVNDGPALKAAHIGIAMGNKGTEVARQAASLILLNDDLSGMITAVRFGRKIYTNLKHAIQYIISIHIPLISIVTLPLILGWKYANIFNPVHIVFLELVMGPTCSIVFENEPMDERLFYQKPRKLINSFFTWQEISRSVFQGLVIALSLILLLYYAIQSGMDENKARTMIFTTLIFSNILLTLTGRSATRSIYSTFQNKNLLVPVVILLTLLILSLIILVEPFRSVFGFVVLDFSSLLLCCMVAVLSVIWIELFKRR